MTVKNQLIEMLIERGMFESQARDLMEASIPELNKMVDDYEVQWDRPSAGYPKAIIGALFVCLKPLALEWIEANCPQAWFKPMFM